MEKSPPCGGAGVVAQPHAPTHPSPGMVRGRASGWVGACPSPPAPLRFRRRGGGFALCKEPPRANKPCA